MTRSEADLSSLLASIYSAGMGECAWADALAAIAAFFGGVGATAFDFDRASNAVGMLHTHGLRQTEGEYAARMNAINSRFIRALSQPGPHTAVDYSALSEAAIRHHEFYDWLARECGTKYFIGSRMIDAGDVLSFTLVDFSPQHGHAEPHEIELFRLITPHIANAWRISRRLAQAATSEGLDAVMQQHAPWGIVGFDRDGCVLSLNPRAEAIVARGDGLRLKRSRLQALLATDDRALQIAIDRVVRTACGEGFDAGDMTAVSRRDAAVPYALRALPLRRRHAHCGQYRARAPRQCASQDRHAQPGRIDQFRSRTATRDGLINID